MKYPKKTKEMNWSKLGKTYILVDPDTKKSYDIDPITFIVWIQCDGKTSVEQITDVFSVDGNRDIVKAAIMGILDKLAKSGLIEWV
ncbi:MAG: PqqD family protein [Candidatus Aenigmarchaeota archaeon]|nr:PqqD family protein [Candidatus Aenigmarchaeota archaeon]